jgi:hypothetical protein
MVHCRTLHHVAVKSGVDPGALRRVIKSPALDLESLGIPGRVMIIAPHGRDHVPELTITPEQTLREAGISDDRQAEYQRRMSGDARRKARGSAVGPELVSVLFRKPRRLHPSMDKVAQDSVVDRPVLVIGRGVMGADVVIGSRTAPDQGQSAHDAGGHG